MTLEDQMADKLWKLAKALIPDLSRLSIVKNPVYQDTASMHARLPDGRLLFVDEDDTEARIL